MSASRRGVAAGILLAGIGAVSQVRAAQARSKRRASGVGHRTKLSRGLKTASVGSKVGATVAVDRVQRTFASDEKKAELDHRLEERTADQVVSALADMKGLMMKVGQMESYADDDLPDAWRHALATLQQDAQGMDGSASAAVIEGELGRPPAEVFAQWTVEPMAAASVGQVHRAVTHEGRTVAVKVQYPGASDALRADVGSIQSLVDMASKMSARQDSPTSELFDALDPGALFGEFRDRLLEELDYRRELANQQRLRVAFANHPFISIPEPLPDLSTGQVLTSAMAEGARFDEVATSWSQEERNLAGEAIFRFVLRSVFELRFFNGDPHPGNYVFHGGGRVTFLDFGLCSTLSPETVEGLRRTLRRLMIDGDETGGRRLAEEAGLIGRVPDVPDSVVASLLRRGWEHLAIDGVVPVAPLGRAPELQEAVEAGLNIQHLVPLIAPPPELAVLKRCVEGLRGLLTRLGAEANWQRAALEVWGEPTRGLMSELGRQEAAWRPGGAAASQRSVPRAAPTHKRWGRRRGQG
jgi:predicted unusual protein kinase regulating ubiquinone biosynthesis (AarF/ABC1/UbiB family)